MKTTFLTNVNPLRTSELIGLLGEIKVTRPLLMEYNDLIILERNPNYLEEMVCALFEPIGISCNGNRVEEPTFGLHQSKAFGPIKIQYTIPNKYEQTLVSLTARVKGTNSIAEKIVRLQSNEQYEGIIHLTQQDQIAAADIYALNIVTEDEQKCYDLKELITQNKNFVLDEPEKDYIKVPKASGYKAIHQYLRWNIKESLLHNLCLEIHYETNEDHMRNIGQVGKREYTCSHEQYTLAKFAQNHQMGEYTIIIIDHEGSTHLQEKRWQAQQVDLSELLQGECKYYLVKGN